MTQEKQTTIIDSIQSEVSREASPLLELLIRHSKLIFLVLIALIAAIVAAGIMEYRSSSSQRDAEEALGKIIIMPEDPSKLAALQEYADKADAKMKNAALFALMYSAGQQGDREKAVATWDAIAKNNEGAIKIIATIAEANNLAASGKQAEAIAVLESLQAQAGPAAVSTINAMIADLAESAGDWDKAIAACESIIRTEGSNQDKSIWEQRIAYFQTKK